MILPYLRRFYPYIQQRVCSRHFAVSSHCGGVEEFFPPGVYEGNNYVEEDPISGRPWKASELRIRSNTDLHKFWYVLLKEKNMLLTLDHECKRLGISVPGPTRLNKVERAMDLVHIVIKERENAILDLEKQRRYKFDQVTENSSQSDFVDTNNPIDSHTEAKSERIDDKQKVNL